MPNEDRVRLAHMIEAAQSALGFVSGRKSEDLETDQMLLFAVVRAIEVVGGAAAAADSHISQVGKIFHRSETLGAGGSTGLNG